MKCVICKHGETRPGVATVTLERGGATVVVKSVPAQVCENCGEEYLDEETTGRVLRQAKRASEARMQVSISEYRDG